MRLFFAVLLLTGIPALLHSEMPPLHSRPPRITSPLPGNFRYVVRGAGVIFSGTVIQIERGVPGSATASGITRISFRVETAIRGVHRGQLLQVREWSGLWNAGERYRVGEQVLLFLYPNSRLGLTSPVGGAQGRFAIDEFNRVLPNPVNHRHLKPIEVRAFAREIRRAARE